MRIEEGLATKLRATSGVSTLVGSRIYPIKAPQDTTTAHIVYDFLGGEDVGAHDGDTGLRQGRISYTCLAPTYAAAKGVAGAVRAALMGFSGSLGTGAPVVRIPQTYEDEDLYDDTLQMYLVVVDFELFWSG